MAILHSSLLFWFVQTVLECKEFSGSMCFTVQLSRFFLSLLSNSLSLRQLVYIITAHILCQQLFSLFLFFCLLTCEPQRMLYYHTLRPLSTSFLILSDRLHCLCNSTDKNKFHAFCFPHSVFTYSWQDHRLKPQFFCLAHSLLCHADRTDLTA